jgi:hypothetical protein
MPLIFLKLPFGAWISDRRKIGNRLSQHFKQPFSSSSPTTTDDLLNLFDSSIFEEENSNLCSIPVENEIYEALTSIEATKAPGPDGFTAIFYHKILEYY